MKENKMQWLINKYNNGECEYKIHNTNKNMGTIVMPTGAGKSGVIYEDMIWHILNAAEGEKIIFNLSAPILKLEKQFVEDFFEVIGDIFKSRIENGEFKFFINSSDDGRNYKGIAINHNMNINSFEDIHLFSNDNKAKFAIVASCHKSLPKFADKVEDMNAWATVINYLDEAHLVVAGENENFHDSRMSENASEQANTLKTLCSCKYLYALTATPEKTVTKTINIACGAVEDKILINVYAQELIKDNIILSPFVDSFKIADDGEITPYICDMFMQNVKKRNPGIDHKILINCTSGDHLKRLSDSLVEMGYKIFSTCSKYSTQMSEDMEIVDADEVTFINEIDNYKGDCFVLHIKQLRQGIDIKSLTDCIMIGGNVQRGACYERTVIQTIGRVLRPATGERGMEIDKRTKKYGNVLLCVKNSDYEDNVKSFEAFLVRYYGLEIKNFTESVRAENNINGTAKTELSEFESLCGDFKYDYVEGFIETLEIDIKKFVEEKVMRYMKACKKFGGMNNFKDEAYKQVLKKYTLYTNGKTCITDILNQNEMMKTITKIFKVYGIAE